MARDTGAQCKQCRREGQKLFLKGSRCFTDKCGVERRSYPPGEHGRGRMRQSEYRAQLREKQKAKRYYQVLEKQFATTTTRRAARRASPARTCCGCSSAAWTTSWCASASPPHAARPGSWSATATGR